MTKPKGIVEINVEWCKGCNVCASVCPTDVLELDRVRAVMTVKHPEKCIGCNQCEMICPDFCIYVFKPEEFEEITGSKSA
ncbi:4Fe-4S binding protein [Desulfurobacterium atlanticum]|uniref:2-oxoglutarate ferredoxin oxidoreductase subunit delta n=1 Tax=Desulfurobacterium atlanticum TaxID=240169 RepID=A0A238XKY0_9BACT|nr:4Fe-4S binding protein [Desulfurobacterium atlanticum]SNR59228.1 2-oxoglutarate ferredoxin oxidoreductase subunit delta [Desulfurobacterium atlanticum]